MHNKSYILLFATSSLYAAYMNASGSAAAIWYKFIDWFEIKNVLLVIILTVAALTYGGVSLFVVIFAVAPIVYLLLSQTDLPRHLLVPAMYTDAATILLPLETSMPTSFILSV